MRKHEVLLEDEWHENGPQHLATVSLCIQFAIDEMQFCSLSVAYACPYHIPTAIMGHSVHNVDINKPLVYTTQYPLSDSLYRKSQFVQTHSFITCPGGWSQTTLQVKKPSGEVLGRCGYTWSAV
jgi:hypothetical protein